MAFIKDLSERLAHRAPLTTDGHQPYLNGVEEAFGADIDYAMLVKLYKGGNVDETRYSPAECIGAYKEVISDDLDYDHASTSYVERQPHEEL